MRLVSACLISAITNKDYRNINDCSKATATRDLTELVEKYTIMERTGEIGAGTSYALIGSKWAQWDHN